MAQGNNDGRFTRHMDRSHTFYDGRVLRAGWGVLFFGVLMVAFLALQTLVLQHFSHLHNALHTVLTPRDALANLVAAIAVTLATYILSTREQRLVTAYGFRGPGAGKLFLGGALAGVVLLSALILFLHQLGLLVFRGQVLFGAATQLRLAVEWLAFYLLAAYVEEALTRGYLQYTLTRGFAWLLRNYFAARSGVAVAFWIAAVLLSGFFALLHLVNGGESALGICNTGLFGLLLVFSLWRTGSLWWALGFHLAWDWAQSFLWGVPDSGLLTRDHLFLTESNGNPLQSGGVTGPEGSVFMLGALLAGFAILMLVHRRHVYPELWTEAATNSLELDRERIETATGEQHG